MSSLNDDTDFKVAEYVSAKQTIPLSVLARNQKKGLDARSPTRPEVGGKGVGKGT